MLIIDEDIYNTDGNGHIRVVEREDEPWLSQIERRHNLFPNIDYRVYA